MNDNFSFYLNNFITLEKNFRNSLKQKYEKGNLEKECFNVIIKSQKSLFLFNMQKIK